MSMSENASSAAMNPACLQESDMNVPTVTDADTTLPAIGRATPSSGMTDRELIGYCDIHCESERALFNERQINRMIELAGYPSGFVREVCVGWYSVHEEMKELVRLARGSVLSATELYV